MPNLGQNWRFFCPVWPLINDLENNKTPLLCYFKLCASFHSHQWIETPVTVQKCSTWVKIIYFSAPVILKFDRWHCKTIGHLIYTTPSLVQYFVAICKLKLEFRAQFVLTSVTLTSDIWLWPLPFAWTSLLSIVITPENFMMTETYTDRNIVIKVRWTEWQMDEQTDRWTDWTIHRAAWLQQKS